jgi:hypothetical protein
MKTKRNNRPTLWYDKNGAPRSEPFKMTLSQIVRDLVEVGQETGVSEAEVGNWENFRAALASKDERSAFALACSIKHNNFAWVPEVLSEITDKARFFRQVSGALDALEGKGKFGPRGQLRLNVVTSYYAALDHLHKIYFGNGEGLYLPEEFPDDPTIPTLAEVKEQFVRQFGEQLLPADWTIRKTLNGLKIRLRNSKRGRPQKIAPKKFR